MRGFIGSSRLSDGGDNYTQIVAASTAPWQCKGMRQIYYLSMPCSPSRLFDQQISSHYINNHAWIFGAARAAAPPRVRRSLLSEVKFARRSRAGRPGNAPIVVTSPKSPRCLTVCSLLAIPTDGSAVIHFLNPERPPTGSRLWLKCTESNGVPYLEACSCDFPAPKATRSATVPRDLQRKL